MGVARRHRGPGPTGRLHHRHHRVPAGDGDPPGGRFGPGLPEQLPPPGLGAAVRAGRQLRQDHDLPVPQLGLCHRRASHRHPRQGPHVPRGHAHRRLRAGPDPHRSGLGQADLRVPVAAGAFLLGMDRPAGRALRPVQARHVHPLLPRTRRDLPHQLEGLRRELQRRLPRSLRAPPPQQAAQADGHHRAFRGPHLQRIQAPLQRRGRHRRARGPHPPSSCLATTPTSSTPTSPRCPTRRS